MSPPRLQPQQYSVALLLGAVGAVLAMVLFGQIPDRGRWVAELGNSAHGPAFAIVTLILIALLRSVPSRNASILRDYSLAIAVAMLLGVLIELMQLATGRDASFSDLWRDTLGALAATGLFTFVDPRVRTLPSRRATRLIGVLVGVTSAVILVAPLVITGAAYLQRHRSFPTLVDFGSPIGTYFIGTYAAVTVERKPLPKAMTGAARRIVGLHVRLTGNKQWGLALWEPYPDWRGYDRLALDLANPTHVPLVLQVRIRDRNQGHDRQVGYLATLAIAPNSRKTSVIALRDLTAAAGRAYVNTAIVYSIYLTENQENRAREFYVMRIWLE